MSSKKLSLALIALLALTTVLALAPTTPAFAVEEPTVSLDYPYMFTGDEIATRTITIENPQGNPDIVEVRVYIASDVVEDVTSVSWSGFVSGTSFSIITEEPWVVASSLPSGYDFILPDGAKGKITLNLDPNDEETEEGVVDKFSITVTIKFADDTKVTKTLHLYVGRAQEITISLTQDDESVSTIMAGETVTINIQTGPLYCEDEGLPLVVWAVNPDGDSVEITKVTTDEDGTAEAEFTPTEAGDWSFYADVVMEPESGLGAQLTVTPAELTVEPNVPTKVVVNTPFDVEGYSISYLTESSFEINVSLTDKYGNPVALDVAAEVELTTTKGCFINATGDEVDEITATIPAGSEYSEPVTYKPDPVWGTYAIISAKVTVPSGDYEGSYTGTSKSLKTSTFATSVTVTPESLTCEAGSYVEVTIDINQENVPVTFEVVSEEEEYNGYVTPVSTTTDEDGVATTKFYVDTTAGLKAKVKAVVSKPLTDAPDNTIEGESAEIETVPGEVAKLGVTVEPDTLGPGKEAVVTIYLADEYDNEVETNIFGAAIRVDLTVTGGTLERDFVYISYDDVSVTVDYTAPEELGTYTITATTTQYALESGSATVEVMALEPIVNITSPAEDTTVSSTTNVTMYIAGWAKPSDATLAETPGTVITTIKYSLNGADNVTVPIVSVEEEKAFFNFSVTLTVNATHTITVYAIDSEGYENFATRIITVTYAPAPPVMPTEISDASTDKPSYSPGEEVEITATVTNVGAEARNVTIRITFIAPDGTPQYPIYELSLTLEAGQSVTPTATYLAGELTGTWTAKIMVIDTVTGEAIAEPVELTVTVS